MYSVIAGLGAPPDSAGAAYVAQWYTRNAYIWGNMNPDIEYVDPLTYLR
jgi:hypothetical protein